jgi:AcrR family transcriptional regulator
MARPKHDPDRPPTRDLILRAAKRAFAQANYANVRLSDVAKQVGISRPSVLYHVGSKENLYDEVVSNLFEELNSALVGAADGSEEGTLLERVVRRFVGFIAEEEAFAPIVLREIVDGRGPGRDRLVDEAGPLLDFLETELVARGAVPEGFPVREAVLQTAMSVMVRSAAHEIRDALWSPEDETLAMVRAMVLGWSEPAG